MSKFYSSFFIVILIWGTVSFGAERVLTCADNNDESEIHIINSSSGQLKAVLMGGSHNSLNTYSVTRTPYGFKGQERVNGWPFTLVVSQTPAQNKFGRGVAASVSLVHVDVRVPEGHVTINNLPEVCW